jgi:hypothetical protein
MKHKNLSTIILLCIVSINLCFSQTRFSKAQLEADLDSLYSVIYDVHPDMFAVMPQEKFEKELNAIKLNLKDSTTAFDLYLLTAPLIHDLKDGHTALFPPSYLSLPLEYDILQDIFPFSLSINAKDTSIIVLKDLSEIEPIIPAGSRITSCNNLTDKELIAEIAKYASGEKFSFRIATLNNRFPILFSVMFPVMCQDTIFDIKYTVDGINHSKIVKTIVTNGVKENFIPESSDNSDDDEKNYQLEVNEELNTAIIRFDGFNLNDYVDVFLDSSFSLIKEKNIEHLIIDLRYNGGGNSNVGDKFFQYISHEPYRQFGVMHLKISKLLKRYFPEESGDKEEGVIIYDSDELIPLDENPLRYNGKTYLLTSDFTFSSAADFSWAFKYFNMGTIIGEETGGLIVCFGDSFDLFKLDNTGLRYKVSFKKFYGYGATDEQSHGIIPDVEVLAEHAMEKAFELIRGHVEK